MLLFLQVWFQNRRSKEKRLRLRSRDNDMKSLAASLHARIVTHRNPEHRRVRTTSLQNPPPTPQTQQGPKLAKPSSTGHDGDVNLPRTQKPEADLQISSSEVSSSGRCIDPVIPTESSVGNPIERENLQVSFKPHRPWEAERLPSGDRYTDREVSPLSRLTLNMNSLAAPYMANINVNQYGFHRSQYEWRERSQRQLISINMPGHVGYLQPLASPFLTRYGNALDPSILCRGSLLSRL